jgi:hypothetical protein
MSLRQHFPPEDAMKNRRSPDRRPRGPVLGAALCALAAVTLLPALAAAQDLHPSRRPSPMGMARILLGDAYLRVVYSRPYERERPVIFGKEEDGALVPFGKVWRTGANEATEITVTADVLVGAEKKPLAEGTYSLFTIPGAESWQVLVVDKLGLSGAGTFNPETREFTEIDVAAEAVVNVAAKPAAIPEADKVDQFTISFEKTGDASADMVLRWILTEVRVPFEVAAAPAAEG